MMILTLASTAVTFIAFVLLLFAVIGDISMSPAVTNIYYYRLDFSTQGVVGAISSWAGEPNFVTFGLWSYCYGQYSAGVQYCSPPKLGYDIQPTGPITDVLSQQSSSSIISSSMSAAIIAFFIPSIVLSFTAVFPGAFSHRSRAANAAALVMSGVGLVCTLVAFIAVAIVFSMAIHDLSDLAGEATGSYGSATWLTLTAAIALWLASCGFLFNCCCVKKRSPRRAVVAEEAVAEEVEEEK